MEFAYDGDGLGKGGERRSCMLTSPLQLGDTLIVVASRGGDDHHPAWLLNLRANPEVEVSLGGAPNGAYVARVATEAERAKMWPTIVERHRNYAGHQKRTSREIPVMLLARA